MTIEHGGNRIHPALSRVVNEQFRDFQFSPGAQKILDRLLESASSAISPDEFSTEGPGTHELVMRLQAVLPSVSSDLRRYQGPRELVSASTLDSVLSGYCPFPPFCFGRPDPAQVPRGQHDEGDAVKVVQTMNVQA